MKYISSDTNVWIDFVLINKVDLPFRLPYTYIMNEDAIEEELLYPENLKANLLSLGLKSVQIDFAEYMLAEEYGLKYKKLSVHDRIALAIAKNRNITLLTGDGRLREAAKNEMVEVMGTLGILDCLYAYNYLNDQELDECLTELRSLTNKGVRLPKDEIDKRLTYKGKLSIKSLLK